MRAISCLKTAFFSAVLLFVSPLPVLSEQAEFVLRSDGDIANQTGQNLDENSLLCQNLKPESWIGTEGGSQGNPSYLALRLHGPQLPTGARILSATLYLTNNRGREQPALSFPNGKDAVSLELRAELNAAPAPFVCTQHAAQAIPPDNLPSARTATQAVVIHSETNVWPKGGMWEIDAAAPLQEAQQDGKLGETIVLLIQGTDTRLSKRYFFNHRQKGIDPVTLPRLTVRYELPPQITPVHVSIIYPPAGANLDSAFTRVQGTHDGPANTGVTVNGQPALVYNGQFAVIAPLQPGANSLSAVASTLQGKAGETGVMVNNQGILPALSLNASNQAGLAPLALAFDYNFSGNAPFNFNFDFEGDGITDFTGTNADSLPEHVYPAPGFYFPIMTISDAQGQIHRAETLVLAQDGAVMDAMFMALWNGMNDALIAGNKTTALQYLNPGAQRKYGPVFDVLMPHMAEIVASYSPPQRASISQYIGEYMINRVINGRNKAFFIYFLQESSGVWYLDAM